MQAFIASVVVAIVLAIGTAVVLDGYQKPAEIGFATNSVRL